MYLVCPALVYLADILLIYTLPYSFYTAAKIFCNLYISFTIIPPICCKNHRCKIKTICKNYKKYIPQVGVKIISFTCHPSSLTIHHSPFIHHPLIPHSHSILIIHPSSFIPHLLYIPIHFSLLTT